MEQGQGGGCFIPYQDCTFRKKPQKAEQGHGAHRKQARGPVTPCLRDPPFPPEDTVPLHTKGQTCPGAQPRLFKLPTGSGSPYSPLLQVLGGFSRHKVISCLKELTDLHQNWITLCISGRSDCSSSGLLSNMLFPPPDITGGSWVEQSSLSHVQVASGLGQIPCPSTRSVTSTCSGHVPKRCPSPERGPSPVPSPILTPLPAQETQQPLPAFPASPYSLPKTSHIQGYLGKPPGN